MNATTIIALSLSGAGVLGTLPSQIGQLTSLTDLILDHNSFSGTLCVFVV